MKGSRPEQAVLSKDTDMSKTDETQEVIEGMVDGLNDHRIGDIGEFFAESFKWMDNQGCGNKNGLTEFQDNWQKPFQSAFSDKVRVDESRLYMGEWAAVFGRQEATPGPATQDGLVVAPYDEQKSADTCQHIVDMLNTMIKHPSQGRPEVMELDHFWHPRMNWYGPAGIGTGRGIAGFRHWHQIPF